MRSLKKTIETATALCEIIGEDHVVGRVRGVWKLAPWSDIALQNQMDAPLLSVSENGLDPIHVARGEISEKLELMP